MRVAHACGWVRVRVGACGRTRRTLNKDMPCMDCSLLARRMGWVHSLLPGKAPRRGRRRTARGIVRRGPLAGARAGSSAWTPPMRRAGAPEQAQHGRAIRQRVRTWAPPAHALAALVLDGELSTLAEAASALRFGGIDGQKAVGILCKSAAADLQRIPTAFWKSDFQ